ncbi:MAG: LacI family DNA-binding transcriptional regulator [Gammaproteobacteria bacterium]|uniref:LacI family DNA-binding transcriptional regulator n=2 Tax=Pseudomonas TaxID=286 RepID=UPI001AE97FF5|nr:LacI family DNA-binding transcriptional regulator [Pseudomonas putida]HDS1704158.1 LacI family DNA-binding transcriptional regulator [Pseudomonas putida]
MVSMKDVAKAAGVSQPAVSYAYSGSSKVSASQREHILSVAASLGYPGPNLRGRSLRSGRVGAIGLVVMDQLSYAFDDPWAMSLLKGIAKVNELANVALTLFPLKSKKLEGDQEGDSNLAVRGLVDGLIISTLPDDHPITQFIVKRNIPAVIIDSPRLEGVHFVGIDDRQAATDQMEHILGLGHTKIAILVERLIPDGKRGRVSQKRFRQSTERIARERLTAYVETAERHGIAYDELVIIEAGGFTDALGREAASTLLRESGVTAVVASSDVMALACLSKAEEEGVAVPGQLSVIGFDDVPDAAPRGLTTIRQSIIGKGECAARILLDELEASEPLQPIVKIFETSLVVRTTTRRL